MCVVSMIGEYYYDKWRPVKPYNPYRPLDNTPYTTVEPPVKPITKEEIDQFRKDAEDLRKLLERAREYDKKNGQPHCENKAKFDALKEIAKHMGVDLSFVDEKGKE